MNKKEERKLFRAPMEIDESGEVVFSRTRDHAGPQKDRPTTKPTALLLCNEVSKMFRNTIRESVDDQRIQGSYRDILFHLAREDGKTQLELARLTHLKPPTVSVALGKLEDEGYIIRLSDSIDQRCTRVYLTEKGKGIDEKAQEVIKALELKAVKGFSDEEIKRLTVLLFRLRENIADDN